MKTDAKKTMEKPEQPNPVWITCRGSRPCEGKTASIVFRKKRMGGGFDVRYKCLSCGGSFHIAT
jgi:hypothetical protein